MKLQTLLDSCSTLINPQSSILLPKFVYLPQITNLITNDLKEQWKKRVIEDAKAKEEQLQRALEERRRRDEEQKKLEKERLLKEEQERIRVEEERLKEEKRKKEAEEVINFYQIKILSFILSMSLLRA